MSTDNGYSDEDRFGRPYNPTVDNEDYLNSEEDFASGSREVSLLEWILFVSRCLVILIFLVAYTLVFINVARGTRLKNWRLYCVVALSLFCWLALSLYQDHIDEYFVHGIYRFPQKRSIYWCIRNLMHGITLYLIVLLLSHLSDFQHRGVWLWLVASVVVVPLIYSVALLIIDLRVHPDTRNSWEWSVGIKTFQVFLYNVLTTLLLFIFSPRFCTSRLFGTYSEHRSSLVVLLSRWTFAFLLLHNLTAIGSYAAFVHGRVPSPGVDIQAATSIHNCLDELAFLFVVLAVPVSYLVGVCGHNCPCCGRRANAAELEMDKVDKIYQQVWTTNQGRPRKGRNGNVIVSNNPEGGISTAPNTQTTNTAVNSPVSNGPNGEVTARSNAREVSTAEKRKKRESYFTAVSMGSLNDDPEPNRPGSNASSLTSDPVDL